MAIIVEFIKDYAPWVYGACALVALWTVRTVLVARRERRYAMFTLEREAAYGRVHRAWGVAISLIVVMGLAYLLSTVVADAVRPLVEEAAAPAPTPTSTIEIEESEVTPTPPQSEIEPTGTPTARPQPTSPSLPTPTVAPAQTPTPAARRPSCPDARAVITAPGIGALVSGSVAVSGSATHESFAFYKLEYGAGANPAVWSYFDGADHPVQGGRLGTLNAAALPPGVYSIRVVVVDVSGNFPQPCQTTIEVR